MLIIGMRTFEVGAENWAGWCDRWAASDGESVVRPGFDHESTKEHVTGTLSIHVVPFIGLIEEVKMQDCHSGKPRVGKAHYFDQKKKSRIATNFDQFPPSASPISSWLNAATYHSVYEIEITLEIHHR